MIINQVCSQKEAETAMIAIGQEIIRRAQETCVNLDRVTSIKIDAEIMPFPDGAITVNIKKNYVAEFNEKEGKESESNDKSANERKNRRTN